MAQQFWTWSARPKATGLHHTASQPAYMLATLGPCAVSVGPTLKDGAPYLVEEGGESARTPVHMKSPTLLVMTPARVPSARRMPFAISFSGCGSPSDAPENANQSLSNSPVIFTGPCGLWRVPPICFPFWVRRKLMV